MYEVNSATPISATNLPNSASAADLGTETAGSTDSVIVAQLTYAYTSPVSYVLSSSYTLTEIGVEPAALCHLRADISQCGQRAAHEIKPNE